MGLLIKIDLMAGFDRAFDGKANGYGSAYYAGHNYPININFGASAGETRVRAGITGWYKKAGITASYSHGLNNFNSGDTFTPGTTYSEVIRLGICYRIL
jgi:hypothetical protein